MSAEENQGLESALLGDDDDDAAAEISPVTVGGQLCFGPDVRTLSTPAAYASRTFPCVTVFFSPNCPHCRDAADQVDGAGVRTPGAFSTLPAELSTLGLSVPVHAVNCLELSGDILKREPMFKYVPNIRFYRSGNTRHATAEERHKGATGEGGLLTDFADVSTSNSPSRLAGLMQGFLNGEAVTGGGRRRGAGSSRARKSKARGASKSKKGRKGKTSRKHGPPKAKRARRGSVDENVRGGGHDDEDDDDSGSDSDGGSDSDASDDDSSDDVSSDEDVSGGGRSKKHGKGKKRAGSKKSGVHHRHKAPKAAGGTPRPLTGYILYSMETRPAIAAGGRPFAEVGREVGARWKRLSDAAKAEFNARAASLPPRAARTQHNARRKPKKAAEAGAGA